MVRETRGDGGVSVNEEKNWGLVVKRSNRKA